jgi:phenylalanine ammonia-lyase
LELTGEDLTIGQIAEVARGGKVALTSERAVVDRVHRSREVIRRAVETGEQVYGVTTLFGGLANQYVGPELLTDVQRVALWQHKSTTGPRLPEADVRSTMLLRANSLLKGASGIRLEIIERYVTFLNAGAHPHVFQRGSIGASGDLVPLSYIGASVLGLDPAFLVDMKGETLDCHTALERLGLEPLPPEPKEGLALNNGTGASTGVAANVVARANELVALALGIHALYAQSLLATDQSFMPFIHAMKPHDGQVWTAARMLELIEGSKIIRSENAGQRAHRAGKLIQDRYGLRCLPQFLGPIVDGLATGARQIEVEANCANDNPLIDPDTGEIFHTGNFLAQYTATAMDSLRYFIGLMAKHIDSQIALMITPEFSNGLNPSLVGNMAGGVNVGFKSLHVGTNQMMTHICFLGQSVADRFPTHAEMYNQNINSQAMNAANIARDQLDILEHFLAAAAITGVQAVELRSKETAGTHDARAVLSPATVPLYEATRRAAKGEPEADQPLLWNDFDGFIQDMVEGTLASISSRGAVIEAVRPVWESLAEFSAREPVSPRSSVRVFRE